MSKVRYIEDIFLDFFNIESSIDIASSDRKIIYSFFSSLMDNNPFTEKQARLLLVFLKKYQSSALAAGVDYANDLIEPVWKHPFRVVDLTKKVFIEYQDKKIWVCAKFPFTLKEKFEKTVVGFDKSIWDHDRKFRKIALRNTNIVSLVEFCKENQIEIDETVTSMQNQVEEIWQQEEKISKFSKIVDHQIQLVNPSMSAGDFFEKNSKNDLDHDAFLAKSMGYPLKVDKSNLTIVEKVSSCSDNTFWTADFSIFFQLYKISQGHACIILDRNSQILEFLEKFVSVADEFGISRSDIKVCFREDKENEKTLNRWIKDNDVGGQIKDGKIFIFAQRPAKWLFKPEYSVKIVATNLIYPDPNSLVRDWLKFHPCVLYMGKVKPSMQKEEKIVEL